MGNIVAFNPCAKCEKKMCSMCELNMYREGSLANIKWISVDERLPEENGRYLVCVKVSHLAFTSITTIAVMDYGKQHGFYLYSEDEPVTHWMSLPEDPNMKGGAE